MKLKLFHHIVIFIILTLAPALLYLPLGLLGYLGNLDISSAALILFVLISLCLYYYLSYAALKQNGHYSTIISLLFYVNFLMYMIVVLIAFNLIVVASFLYTGQVPMGMDLLPSQATTLLLLGFYLLVISGFGMYYLSYSKKRIQR